MTEKAVVRCFMLEGLGDGKLGKGGDVEGRMDRDRGLE